MELDDESKEKLSKQSFVIRYAANYVLNILNTIINGDCDEENIASTIGTLNQNAQCRYGKDDLMNYDQAGKILGFGCTNRVGLKKLLDKFNIKEVVINNMKCGFEKSRIFALRDKLNDEITKRETKRKAKEKKILDKYKKHKNL